MKKLRLNDWNLFKLFLWNLFPLEPVEIKPETVNPEIVTGGVPMLNDPNHWSKDEKFDAEACLEAPYKKHLGRHANK